MFTITDIRDIAIQIERNGEEAYRKAARAAGDPELAKMFDWMADEEASHRLWFESIVSEKILSEDELLLEEMGRQLLQQMVADQTFSLEQSQLEDTTDFIHMLDQSAQFEQDTIDFYDFLKAIIDDPRTKEQLSSIIEEERAHKDKLAELSLFRSHAEQ
ncbi:MAG: ferritin family protein [Desulfofustis sp. PB-SRB1]|jgi:rubrerythrin|nr:ferritin family protein [Desulfofustis sp. PB-SRB1]MBM1002856.1 ferritin family protein [Desulfofustis sp. PB-SRB1]HBH27232.1 hypothetical protein [Desulfofustis sp.]HBH31329.1 hypothetical protein [Desulfofustis sp.]